MKKRIGDIIGGCFLIGWILVILLFAVSALLGLITGELYLPDKKGHGGTLHGPVARIVSLIVLIFTTFILVKLWTGSRRRPAVVHPMDVEIDEKLERMRERKRRAAEMGSFPANDPRRKESADTNDKTGPS